MSETIDEVQSDLLDYERQARSIAMDIDNAAGCETKADVIANLKSAIESAKELLSELREQLKRANTASEGQS